MLHVLLPAQMCNATEDGSSNAGGSKKEKVSAMLHD
jgi:hypothetical protein